MSRIGVDLGGTKIEAILIDDDGTVEARERVATPRFDYDATVETVARWSKRSIESQDAGAPSVPERRVR